MLFSEKLRQLRDAKGLSQKKLADAAGTTQASIARWETGERVPSIESTQALCKALNVRCTVFDGCEYSKAEEPAAKKKKVK